MWLLAAASEGFDCAKDQTKLARPRGFEPLTFAFGGQRKVWFRLMHSLCYL